MELLAALNTAFGGIRAFSASVPYVRKWLLPSMNVMMCPPHDDGADFSLRFVSNSWTPERVDNVTLLRRGRRSWFRRSTIARVPVVDASNGQAITVHLEAMDVEKRVEARVVDWPHAPPQHGTALFLAVNLGGRARSLDIPVPAIPLVDLLLAQAERDRLRMLVKEQEQRIVELTTPVFDARLLQATVARIDLSGLWAPTHRLTFVLQVMNLNAATVTLKGITGQLGCGKHDLSRFPLPFKEPIPIPPTGKRDSPREIEFCQEIDSGLVPLLQKLLAEASGGIVFTPTAWRWDGTIEHSRDSKPLPDAPVLSEQFCVVGPISRYDSTKYARHVLPVLASLDWYGDDGRPFWHVVMPGVSVRLGGHRSFNVTPEGSVHCNLSLIFTNNRAETVTLAMCSLEVAVTKPENVQPIRLALGTPQNVTRLDLELRNDKPVDAHLLLFRDYEANVNVEKHEMALLCQFIGRERPIRVPLDPLLRSTPSVPAAPSQTPG